MLEDCCIVKACSHCFIFEKKNHDKGREILKILNTRGWFKCYNDEMQVYMLMADTGT